MTTFTFGDTPTNSTDQKVSRYVQGGITDRFSNRLGWWERIIIPKATDDFPYTIPAAFNKRPDLVAKAVYNQVGLMWLVLDFNNIVDVETEFVTGAVLKLPTQRRVLLSIIVKPTGGNPVAS